MKSTKLAKIDETKPSAELMSVKERDALMELFYEAYRSALDNMHEAGRILVRLVNGDPFSFDAISTKWGVPKETLNEIYMVGRGTLAPYLIHATTSGAMKLARCPLATQLQFAGADSRVPVVIRSHGETTHIMVKVNDLSANQSNQVFERLPDGTYKLRDMGSQTNFLLTIEEKVKAKSKLRVQPLWHIVGRREKTVVYFKANHAQSRKEWEEIGKKAGWL